MVRGLTRSLAAGVGAAVLAAGAAACTGSSDPASTQGALGAAPSAATGQPQRGGSLQVLVAGTVATWDPQLMYVGPEAFFAQRTFARGLTAYGTGEHQRDVEADLATDTGTPSDGARTWTFTLRPGLTWQDGSPITCDDVRHGVARTFDRRTHVGGTNYASFLLDIPTKVTPEGLEKPVYAGPSDTAHQADFDRAVSCKGPHHHLPGCATPSPTSRTSWRCPSSPRARPRPTRRATRRRMPSCRAGPTGSRSRGWSARAAPSCATSTGTHAATRSGRPTPTRST